MTGWAVGTGNRIQLLMELRRAGIDDTTVLSAIERLPRDQFVAPADQARAWDDVSLPASAAAAAVLRPLHAAVLLKASALEGRERVLLVPTGSGYFAALIAATCRWVYTVEADRRTRTAADARIKALRISNVVSRQGDPLAGWEQQAPFDRIVVEQVISDFPSTLLAQLRDGGSMLVPLGDTADTHHVRGNFATITRIVRTGKSYESESILRTSFATQVRH